FLSDIGGNERDLREEEDAVLAERLVDASLQVHARSRALRREWKRQRDGIAGAGIDVRARKETAGVVAHLELSWRATQSQRDVLRSLRVQQAHGSAPADHPAHLAKLRIG